MFCRFRDFPPFADRFRSPKNALAFANRFRRFALIITCAPLRSVRRLAARRTSGRVDSRPTADRPDATRIRLRRRDRVRPRRRRRRAFDYRLERRRRRNRFALRRAGRPRRVRRRLGVSRGRDFRFDRALFGAGRFGVAFVRRGSARTRRLLDRRSCRAPRPARFRRR